MTRIDRASRLIMAPPHLVYRALVDPAMVQEWLPPKGMRGATDAFDPRPGGAFCITLTFDDASGAKGKSSSSTDVVKGRFVALETNRGVTHRIEFASPDPAFAGAMTMTWTLDPQEGGTMLYVTAEDVPVGIRAEDHEAGMASSLSNLAAMLEGRAVCPNDPNGLSSKEVSMSWSTRIRQTHRWLSIIFTALVAAIFITLGAGVEPAEWVYLMPLIPLALLMISGLYLFALPYAARWRSERRTGVEA